MDRSGGEAENLTVKSSKNAPNAVLDYSYLDIPKELKRDYKIDLNLKK